MVENLTAANVTLAVSVWPDVDTASINWANMSRLEMLIRGRDGKQMVSAQGKYYAETAEQYAAATATTTASAGLGGSDTKPRGGDVSEGPPATPPSRGAHSVTALV